ncbi:MAG: DUF3303 domain-containing protein [Filomicrobium sp.]|jgi:hypothetical protein
MLFVCYVNTDPDKRDENIRRFREQGVVKPEGIKLIGAWATLTQQEAWLVFEADTAASVLEFFEPWTDISDHQITPVMDLEELKKVVDKQA